MGHLRRGVWRPVGGRYPYWTVLMAESKQGTVRDWGREGPKTPPIAEAAGGNHMVDEAREGGTRASEGDAEIGGVSRHV